MPGTEPHAYEEVEKRLRPLADSLPPPRPGDWLAEHDEPGQTFDEYLDSLPVRKGDKLTTIYFCVVGDCSEAQRRILDLSHAGKGISEPDQTRGERRIPEV